MEASRSVRPTAHGWTILLGLALISLAAGQGLIGYALAHLAATLSSVGLLLQPAIAAFFAWVLPGEPLVPLQIAGALHRQFDPILQLGKDGHFFDIGSSLTLTQAGIIDGVLCRIRGEPRRERNMPMFSRGGATEK